MGMRYQNIIGAGPPSQVITRRLNQFASGPALLLPHEFTAALITAGNVDPFGIDPDRTTRLSPAGNVDPFGIDPDRTTPL